MTSFTKNQGFSVSCNHDLLPQFFSRFDMFETANVVDLEWANGGFTILTLAGVEPPDEFRSGEGVLCQSWFSVHSLSSWHRAFPRFESKQFQCALFAFHLVVDAEASI